LRPMLVAANRNNAAARLDDLRVREERTLPPEILFPGARHSQEVKCLAVGHALRSTPRTPYRAVLTSNDGVLTCLVFTRGLESLPTGLAPLSVNAAIKNSSLRSQSSILSW